MKNKTAQRIVKRFLHNHLVEGQFFNDIEYLDEVTTLVKLRYIKISELSKAMQNLVDFTWRGKMRSYKVTYSNQLKSKIWVIVEAKNKPESIVKADNKIKFLTQDFYSWNLENCTEVLDIT